LCASSLLKLIYGARYASGTGPLSVATAVVLIIALNVPVTCALFARGRTALHRVAVGISTVTILAVVYPACRSLGTIGGQVAALCAIAAGYLFQLKRMRDLSSFDLRQYGKQFLLPALASLGMLAIVLSVRHSGLARTPVIDVTVGVTACLVTWALCAAVRLRPLESRRKAQRAPEPVAPYAEIG
jgi:O-antigen/teichoic acid export membrane protein